jgi:hypothetical protein
MKSKKHIGMCGLDCSSCNAFIATKNNDNKLRKKIAKKWSEEYDWKDLKQEDINCTGCLSLKEPLFRHCKECGVRKCGLEKKVNNCGECVEYDSCDKISSLHKMIPDGKPICDRIRKKTKK